MKQLCRAVICLFVCMALVAPLGIAASVTVPGDIIEHRGTVSYKESSETEPESSSAAKILMEQIKDLLYSLFDRIGLA